MIDVADDYLKLVGPKGRNMLRKAERRGYEFGPYAFNEHTDDMHQINVSLPERGGQPMTPAYRERVHTIIERPCCLRHTTLYLGALREGHLWAYCYLSLCGELAIVSRLLGHGDALRDGVMNGLVAKIVESARDNGARFVNYLTIESKTEGLANFKRNVGFRSTPMEFGL